MRITLYAIATTIHYFSASLRDTGVLEYVPEAPRAHFVALCGFPQSFERVRPGACGIQGRGNPSFSAQMDNSGTLILV